MSARKGASRPTPRQVIRAIGTVAFWLGAVSLFAGLLFAMVMSGIDADGEMSHHQSAYMAIWMASSFALLVPGGALWIGTEFDR